MLHQGNANVHVEAHALLPGVCLFCLQDARKISLKPTVRYLRLRVTRTGQSRSAGSLRVSPDAHEAKPAHVELRIPVYCALPYDGLVRTAIRAWKYDGAIELTDWFAKSMVQAMAACESAELGNGIDAVVPVPTSRDRYVKRGYDHVRLFAERISEIAHKSAGVDIPVAQWLYRKADATSFTQSQTAKTARERLSTLQGKFYVGDSREVKGRSVLLVDDVVTTGATLLTCSSALLEAGAAKVVCAAIAQVE
jgi:ComF family protein